MSFEASLRSTSTYSFLPPTDLRNSTSEAEIELVERRPFRHQDLETRLVSGYPDEVEFAQHHLLPQDQQLAPLKSKWRPTGWRVGAVTAAATAFLSLLINIGVTVWCGRQVGFEGGLAIVFSGDCKRVATLNSGIHLGINALSTLLLSGSNYCMQCLCAPNRKEVEKAHARMKWLDIGVQSARNLRHIFSHKVALWWCLGLSSVPLHLMYNSVFFSALATNSYNVLYATPDFAEGGAYDTKKWPGDDMCDVAQIQRGAVDWQRLDNAACIRTYADDLLSDYRNVILVVSNTTAANNSLLAIVGYDNEIKTNLIESSSRDPYEWICDDIHLGEKIDLGPTVLLTGNIYAHPCYTEVSKLEVVADQWSSNSYIIQYCLAEEVPETCSLNFSLDIAIVVMIFNLMKIVCMCYVSFCIRDHPLITVGDAVDSFLRVTDMSSEGVCLLSKSQVVSSWEDPLDEKRRDFDHGPVTFKMKRHKWFASTGSGRWCIALTLVMVALIIVLSLIGYGISQLDGPNDTKSLWALGIGTAHTQSLIKGWNLPSFGNSTFIAAVLIANLPQSILSFIYLFVNGLITSMLVASEWSDFAHERKTLRVSSPRERQRSTYFLQLPYRYAVPLMIISGLIHWLVSQSIFVADINVNDRAGNLDPTLSVSTCGYSVFAMVFVVIASGLLLAVTIGLGYRRYRPGMPLVGTCSVAIAAACHMHTRDSSKDNMAFLPLQWGAIPEDGGPETSVRHCGFSSGEVEMPKEGCAYAGMTG